MVVNPFWFGVVTTFVAEIVAFIGFAIVMAWKGMKK